MSEESVSRRRFLGGVGGGLAIALGAGTLLPDGTTSPIEPADSFPATETSETPLEESETPYAIYQYEPVNGGNQFERTAPINVVFPLEETDFDSVISVFEATGWYHRPAEYARYAYDRETETWHRSHWSGAETIFGIAARLHVRCWELAGTASIQAHIDTPATPRHRIDSYEVGALAVARLFADEGWDIDPDNPERIDFQNAQSPDHPGSAMVISR